jgi:hypothetical protein
MVDGTYEIISIDGNYDYPYCDVKVDGNVNYCIDAYDMGIVFDEVTGDFNCKGIGLKSLTSNTNCGVGQGFVKIVNILGGNLDCSNNELKHLAGGLKVNGNLDCSGNNLISFTYDYDGFWSFGIEVGGNIISDFDIDVRIDSDVKIGGNFINVGSVKNSIPSNVYYR